MLAATMPRTRAATLLLTGFEPFDGDTVNPSWLVAQTLHGQLIGGARVEALLLPCAFGQSLQVLRQAVDHGQARLVLALGLAGGRAELSVERVAVNVDDARIADNAGAQPIDVPVVAGAPAAYFSTLPIKAMVQQMLLAGVPAAVSQTAGTFVCNHVFYGLMHHLRRRRKVKAGFMHLPLLPEQARLQGLAGLDLETQCRGVRAALLAALKTGPDLRLTGGAIA